MTHVSRCRPEAAAALANLRAAVDLINQVQRERERERERESERESE